MVKKTLNTVRACMRACVCCVCERERDRDREMKVVTERDGEGYIGNILL